MGGVAEVDGGRVGEDEVGRALRVVGDQHHARVDRRGRGRRPGRRQGVRRSGRAQHDAGRERQDADESGGRSGSHRSRVSPSPCSSPPTSLRGPIGRSAGARRDPRAGGRTVRGGRTRRRAAPAGPGAPRRLFDGVGELRRVGRGEAHDRAVSSQPDLAGDAQADGRVRVGHVAAVAAGLGDLRERVVVAGAAGEEVAAGGRLDRAHLAEAGEQLRGGGAIAVEQLEQEALVVGRHLDVHARTEGGFDRFGHQIASLDPAGEDVVAVRRDHQVLDGVRRLASRTSRRGCCRSCPMAPPRRTGPARRPPGRSTGSGRGPDPS